MGVPRQAPASRVHSRPPAGDPDAPAVSEVPGGSGGGGGPDQAGSQVPGPAGRGQELPHAARQAHIDEEDPDHTKKIHHR